MNFVMSHIYMEFCKSIQSMKKHYFLSHQKRTKLVYEICLIPIVLWGKLKNKFMIFALLIFVTVYHDACIENLLLRLILFTFRIKLKAPPPSNE